MNKGQLYEEQAVEFLQQAGLRIVERNFHCKLGEIDVICSQGEELIFVEVRYRSNRVYGSPAASVTLDKQRKIIRAAQFYLQCKPHFGDKFCRFDVVALTPTRSSPAVDVQWLKNAFIS